MTDAVRMLAERTLRWRHFSWYWGDAIAIDGLLEAGARDDVADQIERWATQAPDTFDDVLAPGRAIVQLAGDGHVSAAAADRFVAAVDRLPELGPMPALEPHRPVFRFGACIDAVYHLPCALAAYGRAHSDEARVRDAVHMATWTVDVLACPAGWAQWYEHPVGRNNGVAWSRGVGWALLGLLDLLEVAGTAEGAERAAEQAAAMLDRLAATQGPDGHWRAVLDDEAAPYETSTAAFFVAAALHPAARGLWRAPEDTLARAAAAVRASVDGDGVAQGVSADVLPSWDPASYRTFHCEPSPWAQGAALRAMVALSREA